jgi:hypothetical protein
MAARAAIQRRVPEPSAGLDCTGDSTTTTFQRPTPGSDVLCFHGKGTGHVSRLGWLSTTANHARRVSGPALHQPDHQPMAPRRVAPAGRLNMGKDGHRGPPASPARGGASWTSSEMPTAHLSSRWRPRGSTPPTVRKGRRPRRAGRPGAHQPAPASGRGRLRRGAGGVGPPAEPRSPAGGVGGRRTAGRHDPRPPCGQARVTAGIAGPRSPPAPVHTVPDRPPGTARR